MKYVIILIVFLLFSSIGCSSDDCRTCTGTVTNTGDSADWTVCDDNGTVIRTNNLTDVTETSTNTLPEAVAFLISIGLECTE